MCLTLHWMLETLNLTVQMALKRQRLNKPRWGVSAATLNLQTVETCYDITKVSFIDFLK